jgi:hypothetical protein
LASIRPVFVDVVAVELDLCAAAVCGYPAGIVDMRAIKQRGAAPGGVDRARIIDMVVLERDFRAAAIRSNVANALIVDPGRVEQNLAAIECLDRGALLVGDAVVAERDDAAAILRFNFTGAAVGDLGVGDLNQAAVLGQDIPGIVDQVARENDCAAKTDGVDRAAIAHGRVLDFDLAGMIGVDLAAIAD